MHNRPEPLYFWLYFVIINGIWIVVPSMCIAHAATKINNAVAATSGGAKDKAKRK